jgi:hypothetical protein
MLEFFQGFFPREHLHFVEFNIYKARLLETGASGIIIELETMSAVNGYFLPDKYGVPRYVLPLTIFGSDDFHLIEERAFVRSVPETGLFT